MCARLAVDRVVRSAATGGSHSPPRLGATLHNVNDELEALLGKVSRRDPASEKALDRLAGDSGVPLPDDYVAFMASSNGGDGDVGRAWIEFWPVDRVEAELQQTLTTRGSYCSPGTERTPSMDST